MKLELFADGLSEPRNPGYATWAWLAKVNGAAVAQDYGYLGNPISNNVAEYTAIGKALRWLADNHPSESVALYSDSQLCVRQISGEYNCNKEHLQKYRDRCRELLAGLPNVRLEWIPSAQNSEADELTRKAYKDATGKNAPVRHK